MKPLIGTALLLALCSCATVTASSTQDITIKTIPAGASCVWGNTQQDGSIEATPATITVKRMFEPLDVICKLQGYEKTETIIEAKTRGRTYGNILLLGVPAVVDASTGKGYEYAPDEVTLNFIPATINPEPDASAPPAGIVAPPK
jgi:hypothetical protein